MAKKDEKKKPVEAVAAPRAPKAANGPRDEAARKAPEKPAAKKGKRAIAATAETTSLVGPIIGWLVLLILAYYISLYDAALTGYDIDHVLMYVVGAASLLMLTAGPVVRNLRQLTRRFAKGIIIGGAALSLVLCALGVYTGTNFGEPVSSGTIKAGVTDAKNVTVTLPGKHFRLFLHGGFPMVDDVQKEQAAKAANDPKAKPRTGSYKLVGPYALQLRTADGKTVVDNFSGKFEQERSYRRISKRGRGYLDVVRTTIMYDVNVPEPGEYQLHVVSMGDKLDPKLDYGVYRNRQYPFAFVVVGLLAVFAFGLIDTLIKPLRADSYFALTIGAAYGFVAYYQATATPTELFSALGVSLMVGAFMGAGVAYGVYLAGNRVYSRITRKYQISL